MRDFIKVINFKDLFASLKFELENIYNTETHFDYNDKTISLLNAKASVINMFITKIDGFFAWFINCQYLCLKDVKVPVRLLKKDLLSENVIKQIEKRVNMIVDSDMDYHIVKNWVDSKNHDFSQRTMRMVAVCWILVNRFNCIIKGGFIRDFVVRGYEWLPPGDLSDLMEICARNGYLEVKD